MPLSESRSFKEAEKKLQEFNLYQSITVRIEVSSIQEKNPRKKLAALHALILLFSAGDPACAENAFGQHASE